MGELTHRTHQRPALTASAPVNRDGKGVNGVMRNWYRTEPCEIVAKPRRQVLAEFFTSLLVLSATFKFRPVVGMTYNLYWVNGEWTLSLIAPDEWSQEKRAGFAGTCVLQRDMTWTIAPSELLTEDNPVADAVARFYDAFVEKLDTDVTLDEILPYYVDGVPYLQRLYASALSRSLRAAMILGNQATASCRQWRRLIPQRTDALLTYRA